MMVDPFAELQRLVLMARRGSRTGWFGTGKITESLQEGEMAIGRFGYSRNDEQDPCHRCPELGNVSSTQNGPHKR